METRQAWRWVVLFVSLLLSVFIARIVSVLLLASLGLGGIAGFIAGFVLYAIVFFGVLYAIERVSGVSIFAFR